MHGMNVSNLLSTLIKGQWAIDPRMIDTYQAVIDKLLSRDFSPEDAKILSEAKPLLWMAARQESMQFGPHENNLDNLDNLPAESTLLVSLNGAMLKYGTLCSYGTQEIAASMLNGGVHEKIGSIVLMVDSGGGSADSIPPFVDAIQALKSLGKPIVAAVDMCASAAYFVASYCNEIVALNDISCEVGSIGVMCSLRDVSIKNENEGIKDHVIFSTHSEFKNRPFMKALKGEYDEIRTEELDPLALRFQAAIRDNRGNKLAEETPGLLAGKTFFATQAKQVGLIDHIGDLNFAIERARELRRTQIINQYFNL